MNHRIFVLGALTAGSALAVLLGACSGSDDSNVDGGDATTNDVAVDSPATNDVVNDTGNDTGTNDATTDASEPCNGSDAGCRACCTALYPDAAAFLRDKEETCACTTPGDCKQQNVCGGDLCNGKKISGACTACLLDKDAGDCFAGAVAACAADPGCQPLEQCVASCPGVIADAGGGG